MRFESVVTSVSWIPSEAISGIAKLPFELGVTHYDDPPPDVIADLGVLQAEGRFRFVNELRAWIDVVDGAIVHSGYSGGGRIGATTLRFATLELTLPATSFPDLRAPPDLGDGWVRFEQTTGGRTGAPAPRRVRGAPLLKVDAPTAWTTLALTLHSDGHSEHKLVGASPFPRHWIYNADGVLVEKSGLIDFEHWYRHAFGNHSPWGHENSPALVTAVETALERHLSTKIMRAGKPRIAKVGKGSVLVRQGEPGVELFLLLDGMVQIDVDDTPLAEVGPGAILGERAILEGGRRTSTVRALTNCTIAVASAEQIDHTSLAELSTGHHREHTGKRSQPAAPGDSPRP
jgi:hypothetical protein